MSRQPNCPCLSHKIYSEMWLDSYGFLLVYIYIYYFLLKLFSRFPCPINSCWNYPIMLWQKHHVLVFVQWSESFILLLLPEQRYDNKWSLQPHKICSAIGPLAHWHALSNQEQLDIEISNPSTKVNK